MPRPFHSSRLDYLPYRTEVLTFAWCGAVGGVAFGVFGADESFRFVSSGLLLLMERSDLGGLGIGAV